MQVKLLVQVIIYLGWTHSFLVDVSFSRHHMNRYVFITPHSCVRLFLKKKKMHIRDRELGSNNKVWLQTFLGS